jgi:hypothetical protein
MAKDDFGGLASLLASATEESRRAVTAHQDGRGETFLALAARRNLPECADVLCRHGANPLIADKQGRDAWYWVVKKMTCPIAASLTGHGHRPPDALLYTLSFEKETPAAIKLMQLLIEGGARADYVYAKKSGFTAFLDPGPEEATAIANALFSKVVRSQMTFYEPKAEFLKLLCGASDDINAGLPLHRLCSMAGTGFYAAAHFNTAANILLDHGCDLTRLNGAGLNPIDIGRERLQRILRNRGEAEPVKREILKLTHQGTAPAATWQVIADTVVEHRIVNEEASRSITMIFNFRTQRCMTVYRDLSDPQSAPASVQEPFDMMHNADYIDEARKKLVEAGYKPPVPQRATAGSVIKPDKSRKP